MSSDLREELIQPLQLTNPNLPAGTTSIPLHPITLWPVGQICSVLAFPGLLNEARLKEAIAAAAGLWTIVAGRYERKQRAGKLGEYDFSIRLTSSPIPFSSQTIKAESPFPTTDVIQPSLEPYLPTLPTNYYLPNNPDGAQLVIRHTVLTPSSRSVIGINWGHILGDAAAANRFIQHLSHCYLNGPNSQNQLPQNEIPSFFPHIKCNTYPPTQEMIDEYDIPQVAPVKLEDSFAAYGSSSQTSQTMKIFLSRKELAAIKADIVVDGIGRLSEQDALSAWWVDLIERSGMAKINRICYNVNYRNMHRGHPGFPDNLPTLVANVVQMTDIKLPTVSSEDNETRRAEIARAIRTRLMEKRSEPDKMLDWLSVLGYRLEEGAINESGQVLVPRNDEAAINSNLRYHWNVPFGFPPDQVHYHTAFSMIRMLRVFEGNPRTGQSAEDTDIELTFDVPKEGGIKERIEELVEMDREVWAKTAVGES